MALHRFEYWCCVGMRDVFLRGEAFGCVSCGTMQSSLVEALYVHSKGELVVYVRAL